MIERYTREQMKRLWSEEHKFGTWLEVELALLSVLEKERTVPRGTAAAIRKKAKIDPRRIARLEQDLKHDVISFTTSIAEQAGKPARWFHYGMTSSDVVDTSLSILMGEATEILLKDLDTLRATLKTLAKKHKKLVCIGRTHGMHAEPTSFGLKFLGFYAEFTRWREELKLARETIRTGKLSGAVGAYGVLSPAIEARALKMLGLRPETVATQVVPRDRHARVFSVIAGIGASIERVCVELRHLQRTEVGEVEESFGSKQKGSSAMPHKKNPISAENLTGCARLLRGYAGAALENVALWHERDISHSSVERVIAPDATTLLDYMLVRLDGVLKNLVVSEKNIAKNLARAGGVHHSGRVLLKLVEEGLTREQAYKIVQRAAHKALSSGTKFKDEICLEAEAVKKIPKAALLKLMDDRLYLKYTEAIYRRAL